MKVSRLRAQRCDLGSEGDSFDSEKVTSIEALQGRDSSLRVETQGQINELFSGVIERGAQRDSESAAAIKGSDALKRGIVKEADERLPAWREWMRIAQSADDEALYGERGGFYKELIAAQDSDWKETADLLWTEGEFQKYYEHTAPVRREAFTNYAAEMGRRRGEGIVTEPEWIQERDAAYVSDYETYSSGPPGRSSRESERHLARPPRDHTLSPFLEKDPGTSVQSPLEIRQEAAARSERPPSNPMEAFREQVYQEGSGLRADSPGGTPPAFKVLSEWDIDDAEFRLEEEGKWHIADVREKWRLREARKAANVRDVRDSPVPEVQVLESGELDIGASGSRVWESARSSERNQAVRRSLREGRQPVESAETYSDSIERTTAEAERLRASQRLLQQHQADLEMWGSAQASAYEGLGGDVHAKELEALDKKSKTAKTMTLNELSKSTEQHSFDTDFDVRPLDLLRPRARRRSQGLASQRTYGLELELITDLERGEMLGVFGEQVAGGLEIVDDSTIQTARPNVRVERGVDVEFASELFTDEGLSYLEDSFTLGVLAEESADFQAYQGQYTDVPGNEMLDPGDSITRYSHELVFPVMQGQEGLDLIGETYERLGQLETELNTSMGMHVHVGTKDLENYDLIGVWGAFAAREKAIDLMHEKSRQGAGHPYSESMLAGSSTLGELLKIEVSGTGDLSPQDRVLSRLEFARKSSLLSDQSRESFLDTVGYGDRYQKLNLRGSKYNTIEYRQPAASLDFAETEGHISFITDFVDEYAGTSPEWAFQKDLSLEDISSEFGLVFEEPTRPGQIVLPFDVEQHSADAGSSRRAGGREGTGKAETLGEMVQRATVTEGVFFRAQPEGTDLFEWRSRHVALEGDLAEYFADELGLEYEPSTILGDDLAYLFTELEESWDIATDFLDEYEDANLEFASGKHIVTRGGVFASDDLGLIKDLYLSEIESYVGAKVDGSEGGNELRIFEGESFSDKEVLDDHEILVYPRKELYRIPASMIEGFEDLPAEDFAVDSKMTSVVEQHSRDAGDRRGLGRREGSIESIVNAVEQRDDWYLRVAHQDERTQSFQSSANDPRHIEFISDLTRMSRGEYVRESGRAIEMYGKMGDFAQGDFQRAAQNLEDLRPWIQRASELGEQLDLRFQGVYAHPASFIRDRFGSLDEFISGHSQIFGESDASLRAGGSTFMGGVSPADANVRIFTASAELDSQTMGSILYPFETIVRPDRFLAEFSPANIRRGVGEYADVELHSRDAGDPPRTSRKGSVLKESADARMAEALADSVEDDVPVYEDVPPDFFDDVPMSEDFSSDLFDEAGADPFDDVPMYEESFDTQTGRAGAVPEPELEGGSVDLKGVESAVDRARAHRVPYVSDPGVDSDAVRAALAYHQSGEATYRERYGGSETYIEHVPGEGANRVIGSFSPEELAERATERHRRLRSHITGQRDDFEAAGPGADPGDVSLIGSDFDVDSGSGRTAAGRLGRWFSEQVEERSWGTGLRKLSDVGTSGAIISGAAQATVAVSGS